MSPEPSRHYRGDQGRYYHEGKRGIPPRAFSWVAKLRAEKFSPYVRPSDTVFEFGVGSGWNLAELKATKRLGFDVADFLEPSLRARGIEFIDSIDKVAENSMDIVICHHTLEHVIAPADTLSKLRRVLRPGGKLLLFVPFEYERRYRGYDPAEPNHHLYSWNPQTLGNLVSEWNFEILSAGVGKFGYDRFAASLAVKLHAGESVFRLIRNMVHLVKPGRETRVIARKPV